MKWGRSDVRRDDGNDDGDQMSDRCEWEEVG